MSDEEGEKEPAAEAKQVKVSRKRPSRSARAERRELKARLGLPKYLHLSGLDPLYPDPIFPAQPIRIGRDELKDYHHVGRPDFRPQEGDVLRPDTESYVGEPRLGPRGDFTINRLVIEATARDYLLDTFNQNASQAGLNQRDSVNGVIKELENSYRDFDPLIVYTLVDKALQKSRKVNKRELNQAFPVNRNRYGKGRKRATEANVITTQFL